MAPEPNKPRGGPSFHKDGCRCNACKRKTQALLGTIGDGGTTLVSANALQGRKAKGTPSVELPILRTYNERSPRARVSEWLAYRAKFPGIMNIEVAQKMGISAHTLNCAITIGGKEGWLVFDDPHERLKHKIVPKIVDNIEYYIDQKDKTMTIEAARGTGLFQSYQAAKAEGEPVQTMLALKIEHADGGETKVITGHIVGRPRNIEE